MDERAALPKSRFLDVRHQGDALTFSFQRCFEEFLGLNLRRGEAHRAVKSILRSIASVSWFPADAVLVMNGQTAPMVEVASALRDIDERLEIIAERPLSSRMVERALGITARERSRWTKDKRLSQAGANMIRRGQLIALSTYPVGEIARLMNEPRTISTWRESDRGADLPNAGSG